MILDLPDTTNVISATFVFDESDIRFNRQFVMAHVFRCEDGKVIRVARDGNRYPVEERIESVSPEPLSAKARGFSEEDIQHVGHTKEIMGYEK